MYMKELKQQDATDQRILKWRGKSCPPPLPQRGCLLPCPWQEVTGALSLLWSSVLCGTVWEALTSRWADFPWLSPTALCFQSNTQEVYTLSAWQPVKCLKTAIWSLFRLPFPGIASAIPWGEDESAVLDSVLCPPGACLQLLFLHLQASCDYSLHDQESGGSWERKSFILSSLDWESSKAPGCD